MCLDPGRHRPFPVESHRPLCDSSSLPSALEPDLVFNRRHYDVSLFSKTDSGLSFRRASTPVSIIGDFPAFPKVIFCYFSPFKVRPFCITQLFP